ncbi:MAG: PIN domain-containing protein [Cyanobacteriota bacterium]
MVSSGDDSVFLDTNVLIYANVATAPLHQTAVEAIQQLYEANIDLWISRQVLREFIATLTRPQTFVTAQPVEIVVARVQFFEQQFLMAEDGPQVTTKLLELLQQIPTGGRQVHDANIVATMLTAGVNRLLTHNTKDFERFAEFITILPLTVTP